MSAFVLSSMVVVANVTGAAMIVPQVVRLRRHCRVDGISPSWVGVGVALNGWWLGYAVGAGVWAIAPVAGVGFLLYGVIARQYRRIVPSGSMRPILVGAVGASMAPAVALAAADWATAGVVLGVSYAGQFAPAVWTALRATDVGGVAVGTWTMAWIEALAWFGYGTVIVDPALLIGGAGGALMSSVILARLARDRVAGGRLAVAVDVAVELYR